MTNCKNCQTPLKGAFCFSCGQKTIQPKEKTIKYLIADFFQYFTNLDSKFFRPIKLLFLKPGQLTKDISDGITVKYIKISTLFLIGTFIYFIIPQKFIGYGFLNSPYEAQISSGVFRVWKEELAINKIKKLNFSEIEYEKMYDQKVNNNGKLLTLLLIPLTIPVLLLINLLLKIFIKKHNYTAYDLSIASLEINSGLVFILFLFYGTLVSLINYIFFGNLNYEPLQKATTFFALIISIIIIFSFFKRAYSLKWYQSIIASALFYFGYLFVIVFYQFFSFLITY